ncbi:TetR family transcriptional regulator [Enterococcus ureilyticus]|uniref:TetR family transcriptional regulator n=1 Tax=Enterococcus ureilyticus TaxID=1131292 RepID=A0A1E5HCX3_9ENTE|nr:TetR/AcrR family transcriptional regulator [Enterococcus ureilyticus]MBM7687697.1 AcrR family transcriptional regulator [Enterococcus ureilyticus]OEG22787.1 TetR family transcriptional regulator [Enterococcus ureilyticus]
MTKRYDTEATVQDILDAATRLFIEKGYEKTTIQDIVNALDGLSRGAIYHHFGSKEEIIDGVVKRLIPSSKYLDEINQRKDLNGLEKMQQLLLETLFNKDVGASFEMTYSLFNNPKFFMLYIMNSNDRLSPQIEQFINEGNKDGSLNVKYSKQVAEIIVLLLGTWFIVALFPNTIDTFWDKLYATRYILDGINVHLLSDEIIEQIISGIKEKEVGNGRN